ncbi:hypothetical protein P1J78_24390 [Psychromarinibacter sp. C21-152]|uniref:Uncharacterized protein n=1 Tax=Psychromarinibacter sediminicola TaxID=3033385 RepID=A0AAE3P023_9RHOB|nr:hypothetical protein [Psychromarinibacter sediminicola]
MVEIGESAIRISREELFDVTLFLSVSNGFEETGGIDVELEHVEFARLDQSDAGSPWHLHRGLQRACSFGSQSDASNCLFFGVTYLSMTISGL